MPDQIATLIQRAHLERLSTGDWALIGEQQQPGAPARYRLVEQETGRTMQALTAEMLACLLWAGWIERDGPGGAGEGDERRWSYRVTRAGILAMTWPWRW